MNDDLTKCYELLGVPWDATAQELKTAHRDMAKVWHPDRFAHDPRLQQKAQEKLKEINEAYDRLVSGKAGRGRRTEDRPAPERAHAPRTASARRFGWKMFLPAALIFGAVFFAASRALIPAGREQSQEANAPSPARAQSASSDEGQRTDGAGTDVPGQASRRADQQQPAREQKASAAAAPEIVQGKMTPLPTVTLTIDPATGMIATQACPTRTRMTYPAGREPQQYCNASHASGADAAQPESSRPKESRLKSLAKRLSSPKKLFGGKGGSNAEGSGESKQQGQER